MKYRFILGLAGVAACGGAQAILIDDFSQGTYSIFANSANPRAEAVRNGALASIAGGQRDTMLEYTGGPLSVDASVTSGGVHFFNTHSETSGALYLQYDGLDGELETDFVQTLGTGLGLNLSGDNTFVFDFDFVNGGLFAPVSIEIGVTDGSGTTTFTSNVIAGNNILHTVAFSNFGGANFADVRRLDFKIIGPMSSDLTLDSISTVPEPATLAAVGLGLALVARRRRRR